jgi:hypothetical protein
MTDAADIAPVQDLTKVKPHARYAQRREIQAALRAYMDRQTRDGAANPDAIYWWDVDHAVVSYDEGTGEKQVGLVLGRYHEIASVPVRERAAITIHMADGESFEQGRSLAIVANDKLQAAIHRQKLLAAGVPMDDQGALERYLAERIIEGPNARG